uniref:Uncharacterized protein n=1 Tax=Parascaris univalens TaxID=6257 RepID=A0A915A370_PARUN
MHRREHQQPCRVTDRAPLKREIVTVAEAQPREEWKLYEVKGLHEDDGGKIKGEDVRITMACLELSALSAESTQAWQHEECSDERNGCRKYGELTESAPVREK